MKKVLQKSLFRLRTLLLLAVMFVVGGSAWAQDVTFLFNNSNASSISGYNDGNYNGDAHLSKGGVQMDIKCTSGSLIGYATSYNYLSLGYVGTIALKAPTGKLISNVVFTATNSRVANISDVTVSLSDNKVASWENEGVSEVSFPYNADYTLYLTSVVVTLVDDAPYDPIVYTVNVTGSIDANAGVVYKGNTYHDTETISVRKALSNGDITVADVDGMEGSFEIDGNDINVSYTKSTFFEYTFNVSSSNLQVQQGVSVSYYFWNTYNCANPYSGNNMTFTSSDKKIVKIELNGDWMTNGIVTDNAFTTHTTTKIVWEGASKTVTFVGKDSNGALVKTAKIWLEQEAAPVTYHVTIAGNPSAANISVDGVTGSYVDGSSFDTTEDITVTKIHPTEIDGYKYTVSVVGTNITITYTEKPKAGDVITFDLSKASPLAESDVTATFPHYNGDEAAYLYSYTNPLVITSDDANIISVELVGTNLEYITATPSGDGFTNSIWEGYEKNVSFQGNNFGKAAIVTQAIVTLESVGEKTYTVVFDPANIGGSITIGGETATPVENAITVGKTLDLSKVQTVVDPDGYYHDDVAFNSETNTFYVTYHEYTKYSVVLDGESEYTGPSAGVVVKNATYGDGEYGVGTDVISSKGALTQSNFEAKEVELYDGEATLDGNTVTVTYTRKVMPPFSINNFSPAAGSSTSSLQTITLMAPDGKEFVLEDANRIVDLTFVNKKTEAQQTVQARYLCNYSGHVQLYLRNYGFDSAFTTPGEYGVIIPEGIVYATDGSVNLEARVAYTILKPAERTGETPVKGSNITNLTLIDQNFTMTFDTDINTVSTYNVSVTFPDSKVVNYYKTPVTEANQSFYPGQPITPLDEYPFGYADGRDALRVTWADNKIVFTPTAEFWQYYQNHLKTTGYIRFSIDAGGITDANNVVNNSQEQIYYWYSYVVPETQLAEIPAENLTKSLDDNAYGFSYSLSVPFENAFAQNYSYDELPSGVTLSDPDGALTPYSIYANEGNKELVINLDEPANKVGAYTLHIDKGVFNFVDPIFGEGVNAAVDLTWTVTPLTTFQFSRGNVTPATGDVASLNGITLLAPEGEEFAPETKNVTIVVNGEDTEVEATITADQVVLGYQATAANTYTISVPAGLFTTVSTLTNKELTNLTYTIQPSIAINENATDDEGNFWTSFCINKDITLADGYDPYIIRDNGNGGIKLVKLEGEEIINKINVSFSTATEYSNGTIIHNNIDNKYAITYNLGGSKTEWKEFDGFNYIDVRGTSSFTVTVLDPAYMPSKIGFLGYTGADNETRGSEFKLTGESTFTGTIDSGDIGGLYIDVPTGTYNKPIVPAETGILVKGTQAGSVAYQQASGIKADVSGNLLRGCTQTDLWEDTNKLFYRFTWATEAFDNLGFYWDVEGGHSVRAKAGKAFLVLDDNGNYSSSRVLIFGGDDEKPTAIDAVEDVIADAPIFTLQGKRVSRENLSAGVYVQNGKKFIVK